MKKMVREESGFSLIEVVIASLILAAVLAPLIMSLSGSLNIVYRGKDLIQANNLIAQAAEETKGAAFAGVASSSQNNYNGSKFNLTRTVTSININLKRVELELTEAHQKMASITLILYDKGI